MHKARHVAKAVIAIAALFGSTMTLALERSDIERIQRATYEVVLEKPITDPLSYERPLPLELLPFQERNEKYASVGTAFAIAENRFVTAAHVLELHNRTQFGGPFVRDREGKVYTIDQIRKFSLNRDFVEFSLADAPAGATLAINTEPELNERVYAVGNALGEGIVIRDGLYTSNTVEQQDGAWKWLRFSAAASPGNSGGPLLDDKGRVIGVILRKSENENLNYALPIAEVMNAKAQAEIDWRLAFGLDNTDAALTSTLKKTLALPKSSPALRAELNKLIDQFSRDSMAKLLADSSFFPAGRESERLLNDVYSAVFPRLIARAHDGNWDAHEPADIREADLGNNGRLRQGRLGHVWYGVLRKPDDVSLQQFYSEPKRLMDALLKAIPIRRPVGETRVRVTSLGAPEREYVHVDRYGRKWQARIWAQPYNDHKFIAFALPVPGGYAFRITPVPTAQELDAENDMKILSDFVYLSYYGTLADWREFLEQRSLLPERFADIKFDIEYGKRFGYRSPRLAFGFGTEAMNITPASDLELRFSFFREQDRVTWDVAEVAVGEEKNRSTFFEVARVAKPSSGLDDRRLTDWADRIGKRSPFDKVAYYDDRKSFISTLYDQRLPQAPDVVYTLTFGTDGTLPQETMAGRLGQLSREVAVLEYGGS